jgi:hypothetical protein
MSIAASLFALLALSGSDTPDLIVLQDGKEIECRVLWEDESTIVYTEKRKADEVPTSEVASVQSIERSVREYLDRFSALPRGNVQGLLELADFCEARELHGEARHLRLRVLLLDPENETAWTKLGGVHTERRGWRMKVRGRFLDLGALRERVSDWKNALELPTAHFLIRTDTDPARALDLAVDVERAYLAFYDLLGRALRLYPFDEVPEINVYSSADDYPSPPTSGSIAWFATNANVLHVDGTAAREAPQAAVAELSDLLMWNAMRRTVGKTGSMPAWARKGIGQAFAAAFRRDPGYASWDLSQPVAEPFRTHAEARKPLSLDKLMNAGENAFSSGSDVPLYFAQSYTLLHYLAYADDQALRPALGSYLAGAYGGQGSASHLAKALGRSEKEIEAGWNDYVRARAGGD